MAETVYIFCALTSILCAGLLLRSYRRRPVPLLLWVSLCFIGLVISNVLLLIDLILLPQVDLWLLRTISDLVALAPLLYGLIWEAP